MSNEKEMNISEDEEIREEEMSPEGAEAAAETLWPTRCAICDRPGNVLCARCARLLPYVDWWRACRRCGSPFGYVQCDACSSVTLARIGRKRLPYERNWVKSGQGDRA